nr:hypothetical protein CFP56_76464 [Quercus suber]
MSEQEPITISGYTIRFLSSNTKAQCLTSIALLAKLPEVHDVFLVGKECPHCCVRVVLTRKETRFLEGFYFFSNEKFESTRSDAG